MPSRPDHPLSFGDQIPGQNVALMVDKHDMGSGRNRRACLDRVESTLIGEHVLARHAPSHGCIVDEALKIGKGHRSYLCKGWSWPSVLRQKEIGAC
jgi:hypothetical protein